MKIRNGMEADYQMALTEEKYNEIINYAQQKRAQMFSAINDGDKQRLNTICRKNVPVIRRILNWLKTQDVKMQAAYEMGCLHGSIMCMEQVMYTKSIEERIESEHEDKFRYIHHLDKIIKVLYSNGPQSHTDLSKVFQMNPSTLTETMKNILPENLILVSTSGKYKVYSLSDKGRHYAQSILKKVANC